MQKSPYSPKEPDKERSCLNCRIMFKSTGPGNRICPKCKHDSKTSKFEISVHTLRKFVKEDDD